MVKFNSIVLSSTEPNTTDLWLKDVMGDKMVHSKSLWWFTPEGWKKLFDLDTRYSTTYNVDYTPHEGSPVDPTESKDPTNGINSVENTLYVYNGSRTIGNNSNLVNEAGLNKHVEDIQSKINKLTERLNSAEKKINSLDESVSTLVDLNSGLNDAISSLQEDYNSLEERITTLEGAENE